MATTPEGWKVDAKDPAKEPVRYVFLTKTNIGPGKQKQLQDSLVVRELSAGLANIPTKATRVLFNERVEIFRLDYADGSSWQSSGAFGGKQKTRPTQ